MVPSDTKVTRPLFMAAYGAAAALFLACGVALVVFAGFELWEAANPRANTDLYDRFDAVLESIGLLAVSLAALELGQTVIEEEIRREANISAPTRVRRFLSRFLVVIVIALAIECLVATFRFVHEDPSSLPYAAAIGVAAAALLLAWGFFIRQNRAAEELEPEGVERAKQEDRNVE